MAAIVPTVLYQGKSEAQRCILFVARGVTTADTSDLSTWFKKVQAVTAICATGSNDGDVITAPTISSNTTITFGAASLSLDDVYVMAVGSTV